MQWLPGKGVLRAAGSWTLCRFQRPRHLGAIPRCSGEATKRRELLGFSFPLLRLCCSSSTCVVSVHTFVFAIGTPSEEESKP